MENVFDEDFCMEFSVDEDGVLSERAEAYASVEFGSKEDYEEFKEIVKKASAKKPIKDEEQMYTYVETYKCPSCGGAFSSNIPKYCYHCGQKFDWEGTE